MPFTTSWPSGSSGWRRSSPQIVQRKSIQPDMVQVGGVWTPPQARSRGYARSAVALSLRAARERGVRRAILFTGDHNVPAIKAYRALGFERNGRRPAAAALRERLAASVDAAGFRELVDGDTGEGLGADGFTWTAALAGYDAASRISTRK